MTGSRRRPLPGWSFVVAALLLAGPLSACRESGSAGGPVSVPRPAASPTAPEPAPPPSDPCTGLSVVADHRGIPSPTVGIPRGVFELGTPGSGAAVEVVAPYRPTGSRVSASQAVIRQFGPANQDGSGAWRLTVEWSGTLELAVVTPGCEPVTIRCGPVECSVG